MFSAATSYSPPTQSIRESVEPTVINLPPQEQLKRKKPFVQVFFLFLKIFCRFSNQPLSPKVVASSNILWALFFLSSLFLTFLG
jgi:hypothetical protein